MRRKIFVGGLGIGGGTPVSIQSMTNTDTRDIDATLAQIRCLAEAGCELVRLGIPDIEAAIAVKKIRHDSPVPIVCDIHFDHKLALLCIENGADKLRINPGNIGAEWKVREIALAAMDRNIPIRVGVNWGSVPEDLKRKGEPAKLMVDLAEENLSQLIDSGFEDIVVSLKASDVPLMVAANRLFAERFEFPLHLGVTEAGLPGEGAVKSAIGIGSLLLDCIGDTIRVSLTGDPLPEIEVARQILTATRRRAFAGLHLVSCPTCSRKRMDVECVARFMTDRFRGIERNITLAVMGCEVNGPGEARDADIGIAGTIDGAMVFSKGEMIKRFRGSLDEGLLNEIAELIEKELV